MAEEEVFIQTYKGNDREIEKQYRKCAALLAKRGFYPVSQSAGGGGFSAGHIIAFGLAGLAAQKQRTLTVTYRKT